MEQTERPSNYLQITGTMSDTPVFSHDVFSETFYQFTVSVPRLSGVVDMLPVTISERLLQKSELEIGMRMRIEGQVRSYNKVIGGVGRLLITAFAQKIMPAEDDLNPNSIQLIGTLCKPPAYRTTPFGREIADIMLAVNRSYGKSDYIPCIAWGRNARFASRLTVSEQVFMDGRFQSRIYTKLLPDGTKTEKTAYEISVGRLESIKPGSPLHSPAPQSVESGDISDVERDSIDFMSGDDN